MDFVALDCAVGVGHMFQMPSTENESHRQSPTAEFTGPLEMLPERRMIICCDTKYWTIAIGWIKLGLGICSIIWHFSKIITQHDAWIISFYKSTTAHEETTAHLGIRIAVNFAVAGMGLLLLFGASKECATLLLGWLIFNAIATVVLVIDTICEFLEASNDVEFGPVLVEISVYTATEVFFMWVVYVYREEINEREVMPFGVSHPPRYYSFTQNSMPTAEDFLRYYPQRYDYNYN